MNNSFLEKLLRAVREHGMLSRGDGVVVALSGGADSVALLASLVFLGRRLDLRLLSVHVHHGIRGAEADGDAALAESVSRRLGVPFRMERIDVPAIAVGRGESLELAGRNARYSAFRRILSEEGYDRIATGHHLDDQAETVLMRMIRGTGGAGLRGVEPVRGDSVIRPLIYVSKREILSFLKEEGLPHAEDSTNSDGSFLRNRIRRDVMPVLEDCSPGVAARLSALGMIAGAEADFVEGEAGRLFPESLEPSGGKIALSVAGLAGVHEALQRRVIRNAVRSVSGTLSDLDFASGESVRRLLSSGGGKTLRLRGVVVRRAGGELVFERPCDSAPSAGGLEGPSVSVLEDGSSFGGFSFSVSVSGDCPSCLREGGMTAVLDRSLISGPLSVRFRRPGDRFRPFGMRGSKKLKDFFADAGVPPGDRDAVPVVTDSSGAVVWVVGHRISGDFAVGGGTSSFMTIRAFRR